MRKIDNSVMITGIIVVAVIIVVAIGFSVFLRISPTETIQVNGISTISVDPDLISVNFNVETIGNSASEAKDKNALIVDSVILALMGEGFAREDIVTEGFNVYEEFDWNREVRTSIGFKAVHRIKVELTEDKLDLVGEVIDLGIDSGAMISYINFELSEDLQNEYKADALRLATEDARIKAEAMADGLGAKLGRVVSVSSSEFGYYPFLAYAAEDGIAVKGAEIETNIQPGERDVTGRVTVVYKIK